MVRRKNIRNEITCFSLVKRIHWLLGSLFLNFFLAYGYANLYSTNLLSCFDYHDTSSPRSERGFNSLSRNAKCFKKYTHRSPFLRKETIMGVGRRSIIYTQEYLQSLEERVKFKEKIRQKNRFRVDEELEEFEHDLRSIFQAVDEKYQLSVSNDLEYIKMEITKEEDMILARKIAEGEVSGPEPEQLSVSVSQLYRGGSDNIQGSKNMEAKLDEASEVAIGSISWKDLDLKRLIIFTALATVMENSIMYPFWVMKTRQMAEYATINPSLLQRAYELGVDKISKGYINYYYEMIMQVGVPILQDFYKGFLLYSFFSLPAYILYVVTYTWSKSAFGFLKNNNEIHEDNTYSPGLISASPDSMNLKSYSNQQRQESRVLAIKKSQDLENKHNILKNIRNSIRNKISDMRGTRLSATDSSSIGIVSGWKGNIHINEKLYNTMETLMSVKSLLMKFILLLMAPLAPLAAGIFADAISLGFYIPVDIVIQRLQLPELYGGNFNQIVNNMWSQGGVSTFYTGTGITIVTSAVSSGLWWFVYENLKDVLSKKRKEQTQVLSSNGNEKVDSVNILERKDNDNSYSVQYIIKQLMLDSLPHMSAGFMAGIVATIISNPLDIVKTRLQTAVDSGGGLEMSITAALFELIQQEGVIQSFRKGLLPKLITTAPLGVVSSIFYEGILYFSQKNCKFF